MPNLNPISIYKSEIEKELQKGQATEHTYRPALIELMRSFDKEVTATNEPKHRTDCGAPDIAVSKNTTHGLLTIGNMETKDIGVSLDEAERSDQLKRYLKHLPNLILTDYLEFRWYVDGKLRDSKRLARVRDGKIKYEKDGAEDVLNLLKNFIEHPPEPISDPHSLAQRMAHLTHMIRDSVIEAFEKGKATQTLQDLRGAFAKTIIPDIDHPDKTPEFADMYAQTLAYGLFAARCNHKGPGPFERRGAAQEIPKTNPFLRRLFEMLTGTALEDEPYAGFVDDLVSLLAHAEMEAVLENFGKRKGFEDPIVHFYETFLSAYDPKLRETRGVYYTPEPVVSYIVRSVDHILREHFGLENGLADKVTTDKKDENGNSYPKVLILDPACGTGTFLYAVVNLIREQFKNNVGMWKGYVEKHLLPRLFGFELLMAPYAVAHFKLGMQLAAQDMDEPLRKKWAYDFSSDERLGVFLTNTLEEVEHQIKLEIGPYRIIAEEANAANQIKHKLPIMVIMGNPPYSANSANKGEWINDLVRDTYYPNDEIRERNPKLLLDDYVKFIRWAQWRIENTGAGILAFISNHGYLDNPTFRGMRRELMKGFDEIFVLDLHGNAKKKEKCPDGSKDENVFDIMQGVAIGIFVKNRNAAVSAALDDRRDAGATSFGNATVSAALAGQRDAGATSSGSAAVSAAMESRRDAGATATVHHFDLWGLREGKYQNMSDMDIKSTPWKRLDPQPPFYLFIPQDISLKSEYEKGLKINDIFPVNSTGIKTHRDHFVLDFDKDALEKRISEFRNLKIEDSTIGERYELSDTTDWKLSERRRSLNSLENWKIHFTKCLYRPFDIREIYYHIDVIERPRPEVMRHMLVGKNIALIISRQVIRDFKHVFASKFVGNVNAIDTAGRFGGGPFVPLYLYPDPDRPLGRIAKWPAGKDGRVPNLDPGFIREMGNRLGLKFVNDSRRDAGATDSTATSFGNAAVSAASQSQRDAGATSFGNAAVPAALASQRDADATSSGNATVPVAMESRRDASATNFGNAAVSAAETFTPEDVFNYIYAVFHSPLYRERYKEFLKMDFPRVPLTTKKELFRKLCEKGGELVSLHLLESPAVSRFQTTYPETGDNLVEKGYPKYLAPGDMEPGTGKKLKKGRVYINKAQHFDGVPPEVWEFHIGGYQVCHKWLKDRVGRKLSSPDDLDHYQKIVVALSETIRLMKEIDEIIEAHGGWPLPGS